MASMMTLVCGYRKKGKKLPAGPKAKPKKKKCVAMLLPAEEWLGELNFCVGCRADSEEDENMYDFHQAGSDVEEDIFEDAFVKLEWDMGRDGNKVL